MGCNNLKSLCQSEQRSIKLKEICSKIGSGTTPRGGEKSYKEDGIPLIRSLNIYDLDFEYKNLALIDEFQARELENVIVEPGDILINITGASVGRCTIPPKELLPARVNQHVSIIRVKSEIADPYFVLYYLVNPNTKNKLLGFASAGATREALTKSMLEDLDIDLPSIYTQKGIAHVLKAFDDRIKANRKINKTLEEIARAIFKHWFTDFEFPNENGEPYKSSGGEMSDSPLGPIPKGWRVGSISDIANILGGGTPRTSIDEYWDGDIPFFTPKDAKALYCIHTEKCLTKKGLQSCRSRLYEKNTVFITARGTVGKLALAGTPMAMNQSCYALTGKEVSQYFLYFAIDNLVDSLKQSSHGAVFSTITTATLESTKALIPEASVERNFRDRIASFFEIMLTDDEENGKLSKLREALLPKLISGEIRVTDIEDKLRRGSNAEST